MTQRERPAGNRALRKSAEVGADAPSLPRRADDPAPLAVTVGETVDELLRRHELDQANDRQWLELGRKLGYTQGYAAAEADMDAEWAALAEKVQRYRRMAPQDELQRRREAA